MDALCLSCVHDILFSPVWKLLCSRIHGERTETEEYGQGPGGEEETALNVPYIPLLCGTDIIIKDPSHFRDI